MNEFERKIAELSARFAAKAGEQCASLAAAQARGDLTDLRDQAHKLAGIAGMLGQAEIGAAAFALESALEAGTRYEEQFAQLQTLLTALEIGFPSPPSA